MATTTNVVQLAASVTVTREATQVVSVSETHTVTSLFGSTTETVFVFQPFSATTSPALQMSSASTSLVFEPASAHGDHSKLLAGIVATLALADIIFLAIVLVLYLALRHWRSKDAWRNARPLSESVIRGDRVIGVYSPRDEDPENLFRNPGEYASRRSTRLRTSTAFASLSIHPLSTSTAAASIYSQNSGDGTPPGGMSSTVLGAEGQRSQRVVAPGRRAAHCRPRTTISLRPQTPPDLRRRQQKTLS
ncbi:hypothetical protein C8Q79DRAFT_102684 [Trametes meyenii]|nr:hypothetical protein C8Q79DRAFT_102684 [Trametes meyenii]